MKEVEKASKAEDKQKGPKPSFTKAIGRTFGVRFLMIGLFTLFEECVLR